MNLPRLHVSPEEFAALEQGMFATPNEPEWNLGMLVLERIKTRVTEQLPPLEAVAWLRIVMAPMGLRAARITQEMDQKHIAHLEGRLKKLNERRGIPAA